MRVMMAAASAVHTVKLSNGYSMPTPGLGTSVRLDWTEGLVSEMVSEGIRAGYRHIDTAQFYGNEAEVGEGIQSCIEQNTVSRDEIFITTKLNPAAFAVDHVFPETRKSLAKLKTDCVELYMMHVPYSLSDEGLKVPQVERQRFKPALYADGTVKLALLDYLDTYKEMEKLVDKGLVKSLGLSNFNASQIRRVCKNCRIKPVCLQVECHLWFQQNELLEVCKEFDIVMSAFAPLGSPVNREENLLADPSLCKVAERLGRTPAQICLRHLIERGIVPLPKSSNPERLKSNLDVFSFELTAADKVELKSLDCNKRLFRFGSMGSMMIRHPFFPWPEYFLKPDDECAKWTTFGE